MRALFIAFAVLFAVSVMMFMAWRNAARERKAWRAKCAELTDTLNAVLKRLSDMERAAKIVADNRREADAKIDALHTGDACGNAIDVLSKPPAGG